MFHACNVGTVLELLNLGNTRRTQSPTDANATSSRSHAVLQIIVEQQDKTAGVQADIRLSKLSLIDLAGSERASASKNRGKRLLEGANINRRYVCPLHLPPTPIPSHICNTDVDADVAVVYLRWVTVSTHLHLVRRQIMFRTETQS